MAVAVLHRLYQELSAGQCTEELARTLLKVMSENCRELETCHRGEYVSVFTPQQQQPLVLARKLIHVCLSPHYTDRQFRQLLKTHYFQLHFCPT